MINNVGPGIRLIKRKDDKRKTYTNVRSNRPWNQVVVTPSKNDTNTSPLTGESNSKIEHLFEEVNSIRKEMEEERKRNRDKFENLADALLDFKDEFKLAMKHQQEVNNSILDTIGNINQQMKDMQQAQTKISNLLLKVSKVYTPNSGVSDSKLGTQEQLVAYDSGSTDSDENSMDFSMTDLKRSRERILEQEEIRTSKLHNTDENTQEEKSKRLFNKKSSGRSDSPGPSHERK